MGIQIEMLDGELVSKQRQFTKNPNSAHAQITETIKQLPVDRPFACENETREDGKVKRVDSQWRKALQGLAATGETHAPSGQPYTNLHFERGVVGERAALVLRVGAPVERKRKNKVAAE